jgi:hypothetical protein
MVEVFNPRLSSMQTLDIKGVLAVELREFSFEVRNHERVDILWGLWGYEAIDSRK